MQTVFGFTVFCNLFHIHLGMVCHFLPDRDVPLDESYEGLRRVADGLHRLLSIKDLVCGCFSASTISALNLLTIAGGVLARARMPCQPVASKPG